MFKFYNKNIDPIAVFLCGFFGCAISFILLKLGFDVLGYPLAMLSVLMSIVGTLLAVYKSFR